jgi:hypothetical protein
MGGSCGPCRSLVSPQPRWPRPRRLPRSSATVRRSRRSYRASPCPTLSCPKHSPCCLPLLQVRVGPCGCSFIPCGAANDESWYSGQ